MRSRRRVIVVDWPGANVTGSGSAVTPTHPHDGMIESTRTVLLELFLAVYAIDALISPDPVSTVFSELSQESSVVVASALGGAHTTHEGNAAMPNAMQ